MQIQSAGPSLWGRCALHCLSSFILIINHYMWFKSVLPKLFSYQDPLNGHFLDLWPPSNTVWSKGPQSDNTEHNPWWKQLYMVSWCPIKLDLLQKLLHWLYCKVSVIANWCWCLLHQPTEGFVFQARWKGCNGRKRQVLGNGTMKIPGNERLFCVRSRCTCRTVRCDWAPLARLTQKDPVRQLLAGHSQSPALQMVSRWYLVHTFITPRCPDLRVRFCISSLSLHVQSMKPPMGSFQPLMHEFCCAALLLQELRRYYRLNTHSLVSKLKHR